jgi:hypothetical protein
MWASINGYQVILGSLGTKIENVEKAIPFASLGLGE